MRKIFLLKKIIIVMVLISLSAATIFGNAAYAAARVARRPTEEQKEFASFIDGFIAGVQKERAIPGLAFTAVRDGEVLYLKGYGTADSENGRPVDPEKTLFRAGAISQPVTAVAVMQLAERGRIDLDEDVNIYLRRWKISGTFDKPITPRHLLTHTSGLDYKELETAAPTSSDERAYASKLRKLMPRRISEPGMYYRVSSMGYALLGSIVERYSRMNFDAAMKKYVFTPLGMPGSAFILTSGDMKNLAVGYDAAYRPTPYEYRYDLPATGMSTTAYDMGRFMIAQLAGGAIGRSRALGETHSSSMMRRHFSPHRLINGAGLGYLEKTVRGLRTLQQYGDMPGFSSFLMLIPEKNFGMFMTANVSGIDFSDELANSMAERFFPTSIDQTSPNTAASMTVYPDIQGYYRINSISHGTAEKITKISSDQIEISIRNNYVVARQVRGKTPSTQWLPIPGEKDIFKKVGGDGKYENSRMFFQRDELGAVTALVMDGVDMTYEKLKIYESYYWQWVIISGFVLTALLSFFGLFIGSAINKGKFPWEKGLSSDTELWGISSIFCVAQISFVAGLLISNCLIGNEFKIFVPYQVKAIFLAPLAGGLFLTWLWFRIMAKILSPDYHWLEKSIIISLAFAETGYMFFLANWRLLGFMF